MMTSRTDGSHLGRSELNFPRWLFFNFKLNQKQFGSRPHKENYYNRILGNQNEVQLRSRVLYIKQYFMNKQQTKLRGAQWYHRY